MITIKKPAEIEKMRRAGAIVADVLKLMRDMIKPGIDTLSLDTAAEALIVRASAKPAFKGYRVPGIRTPFPSSLCISVNNEVVHGLPSADRELEEGDIVSVDVGAMLDGYFGDAACSYEVGSVSKERSDLLKATHRSLHIGMEAAMPGATIGDIGHAIESYASGELHYGLVRDYTGHGIGKKMHEAPQIPNYGKSGTGITLKAGMTICIEPMVMSGAEDVRTLEDGWTVVTNDGSDAAHFEHTLLIAEDGVEILTPWE